MISRNTSRKKPPGGSSSLIWLTLGLFVAAIFVFLAFHAHVQLDLGHDRDKLFITNQIHKLEVRENTSDCFCELISIILIF